MAKLYDSGHFGRRIKEGKEQKKNQTSCSVQGTNSTVVCNLSGLYSDALNHTYVLELMPNWKVIEFSI